MAGSIRICLIAEGFTEDLVTCVDSITANTKTPISIYANGKSNWISPDQFDSKQVSLTQEKNPLGWGNVINHFLNTFSEDYLLIMDTSTTFTADPIAQTLNSLEAGYQGVGWKGGLVNLEDEWRTTTDKGAGEVDVLFGYYFALDRKFAISAGGANPSAKYYRNADLELSLAIRDAGGKLMQIDLPLSQGRHHGYHDVDPDYRDKNSRKNYQRILDRFRGKNEILSPRRQAYLMEQLSNFTTLKVGGPAQKIVHAHTEDELVEFVKAADKAGEKVLILGGGSNLLISDAGFAGTVIRVESKGNALDYDACSGGMIEVSAGEDWDKFVELTIEKGFADLESLSGIPGTVGGAPIQNIGAYGHEVSETIARVKAYDRKKGEVITFTNEQCHFSYRNSAFKEDAGRYVILNVTFQLRKGEMSLPITYAELANYLSVNLGDRAPVMKVRQAVLELRGRKGMLINSSDVNSNSAGSFFVNPILTKEIADKLPADAPRWPQSDGRVKTSAAWLMEHAGVNKGEKLAGAQISSKHVLALTNSGDATADNIIELAKMARAKVFEKFGIKLEAEVQLVGLDLN